MAHRHKVQKRADGGKVGHHESHEEHEHEIERDADEADTKKRGGAVKRKEGGRVFGRGGRARLGKYARGGAAGGGSDKHPFSSAGAGLRTSYRPHPK